MNIAKGIHTIWPTIAPLEALLPVARVFTGRAQGSPVMPYASVMIPAMPTVGRSDKGMFRVPNVRIQVWSEDYASGKAIQTALVAGFENLDFDLDDGHIDDMHHDDSGEFQEEKPTGDVWQFVTVFSAAGHEDRTN